MADAPKVRFEPLRAGFVGVGRQNGHAGFDQYTELKSVAYPVA
jgi:hypothetical protein